MAYFNYYQAQYPGWGQQQYANQYANQAFVAPPVPSYQPQPSWTGQDYYTAHYGGTGGAYENDVGMFDYVWSRLKNLVGVSAVGHSEARHWHHRVYGGLVDITSLLPADLGAAAGYEALRLFNYHKSIYRQPLMDDREREEEALAGLAIAEATKLWSYCQRPGDKYGRRESCEVAAATAERLFRRGLRRERERDRDGYGGYDYEYGDDSTVLGGGYSSSDDSEGRRKRKNRRRRRSSVGLGYGGGGMGAVSAGQLISAQAAAGGYTPGYGGQQLGLPGAGVGVGGYGLSPNMGGGLAMPGVGYQPGTVAASPYLGAGYAAAGVGQQQAAYQPAYGVAAGMGAPGYGGVPGGGLGVPQVGRPRSSSFGYPASPSYY